MSTDDEYPYMVDPVGGEAVPVRPDGCPNCGADLVTVYATSCWKCHATFPALRPPDGGTDAARNDA